MKLARSPLAPRGFPAMPPVAGVRLASVAAGLRYQGRPDLMLAVCDPGTCVAGTLTTSKTRSAPVDWCARGLEDGSGRAVLVNAGNANAFTGKAGEEAVRVTVRAAAGLLDCAETEVFPASTGTIGVKLDGGAIAGQLPNLQGMLADDAWEPAAEAIRTTDTFAKGATRRVVLGGKTVTLCGIAKGSGMIAPDMATMLAFVFTDAAVGLDQLQAFTRRAVDLSFNAITVDSDTSTSDTCLVFATGKAGNVEIADTHSDDAQAFSAALDDLMRDLAHQIVRDGEGATKFVEVTVTGAESDPAARAIGLAIANSPLVKTAVAGQDPNWGRIVAAVGKAGEQADRDRLTITIGGIKITENGELVPDYDETPVAEHMTGQDIAIAVDVGIADGRATVWTCDLTKTYIDINADYRS